MTDVQWSRDWLLENTALPLIESMEGRMTSFRVAVDGRLYLDAAGMIENDCSAGSLNVYADEPKLVVAAFMEKLKNLKPGEVYRSGSVPHKRYRYREFNGTGMVVPAERPK